MFRFSSYTIVSDRLPGGGYAVLNGCSGALDLVSDHLGEQLQLLLSSSPHGKAFCPPDLLDKQSVSAFVDRGHLTEVPHEDEKSLVHEIAAGLHEQQQHIPYFMIAPNMDCNYRCTYCFERHIQKKLKSEDSNISYMNGNVLMRREFVPAIYDAIGKIKLQVGQAAGGMVILYGGEPLDGQNLDLVFDIAYSGRELGYWFAAITNGHDLDKYLPIINADMLNQIQISIDGPKRVHDKRRIYRGHESSFDKITSNIRQVLSQGGAEIQIRVHVDPTNIDLFEETLELFEQEGWLNHPDVVIYANTVYKKEKEGQVCVGLEVGDIGWRLHQIAGRYENVYTSAPAVHVARTLSPVFESGDRFGLKGTYCSANSGNYIFAPDGHIYSCWESIGKECSKIGSYMPPAGLMLDDKSASRWFSRHVGLIPQCLQCEFALVCGGGCAQYAEYNTGSLFNSYCDDFQRTFRRTLADRVESYLEQEEAKVRDKDGQGLSLSPMK